MAAHIVPVPKKDGQIRICGDFKVTVNSVLQVDQYPLPKPEDLFAALTGGQKFTKLDLRQAYQQMLLEEDSKELVTIDYQCSSRSLSVQQVTLRNCLCSSELWTPFSRTYPMSFATLMTS